MELSRGRDLIMRNKKISADISEEANELLNALVKKHERSKGYLLEKMIRAYSESTNTKPVKKKKSTALVSVDVAGLNVEAWDKWITFRKKAKFKAYKTDATKEKLATMGNHAEQMKIVQNSIDLEYQGLFPLKTNNSAAKTAEHESVLSDTSWANNINDVL